MPPPSFTALRAAVGEFFLRPGDGEDRPGDLHGAGFTAPVAPSRRSLGTPRPQPPSLALLAAGADAGRLAAALALAAAGPGVGLLCTWGAPARSPLPAAPRLPAARRLASALTARGLAAEARGRLVALRLPADEREAVAACRAAEAVHGAAAQVVLVAGARGEGWDAALLARDAVLVRAAHPELTELAVERLRSEGAHALALAGEPSALAGGLAAAGLALPGALRPLRDATAVAR